MDTTVTSSSGTVGRADKTLDAFNARPLGGGRGGLGDGPGGPNGKGPGGGGQRDGWTPGSYRIGVLVGLASITMMFSALASAYIVRSGLPGPNDWQQTTIPSFLWVSTAVIVASSFTVAFALKSLKGKNDAAFRRWLGATLVLGLAFISSQLLAWKQLVAQGLYLASNPHSSFLYVLTGLHGIHLLGGIGGLSYLIFRAWRRAEVGARGEAKLKAFADVVAIYWHFMDGLWVFLFLLLFLWR